MNETLKIIPSGDRELIMTRTFAATREQVFDALTQPELVQRWLLGPPGWAMPVCEIDLKIGGAYRYVWRNADGREMGMGGKFLEIARPERLVHTELFDESWYVGEALITSVLAGTAEGTILTVTMRYESKEARDSVIESGMESGVSVSYDRLDDIFSSAKR